MEIYRVPIVTVLLPQRSSMARALMPLSRSLTLDVSPRTVGLCPETKSWAREEGLVMLARHMSPWLRWGRNSGRSLVAGSGKAGGGGMMWVACEGER